MKPTSDDVQQMVAALFTLMNGLERAQRQGDANNLALFRILATRPDARPSDIALELGVHQSTITRQVRSLENSGFVEVAADPEDRRSCVIRLTETGWGEVSRLTTVGLSRFATFVADWDAEEVRTLARLLTKLENSKAEFNTRETRPDGRHWQKKS